MTTSAEINQRVQQVMRDRAAVEPFCTPVLAPTPAPTPVNNLGNWLCVLLLLVSLVAAGLAVFRPRQVAVAGQPPPPVVINPPQSPVINPPPYLPPPPPVRPSVTVDVGRMDKLEQKVDVLLQRVWLLAVAHNENFNLQKCQGAYGNDRYITFDAEWKMNRMPESMLLSDSQREIILNHLR